MQVTHRMKCFVVAFMVVAVATVLVKAAEDRVELTEFAGDGVMEAENVGALMANTRVSGHGRHHHRQHHRRSQRTHRRHKRHHRRSHRRHLSLRDSSKRHQSTATRKRHSLASLLKRAEKRAQVRIVHAATKKKLKAMKKKLRALKKEQRKKRRMERRERRALRRDKRKAQKAKRIAKAEKKLAKKTAKRAAKSKKLKEEAKKLQTDIKKQIASRKALKKLLRGKALKSYAKTHVDAAVAEHKAHVAKSQADIARTMHVHTHTKKGTPLIGKNLQNYVVSLNTKLKKATGAAAAAATALSASEAKLTKSATPANKAAVVAAKKAVEEAKKDVAAAHRAVAAADKEVRLEAVEKVSKLPGGAASVAAAASVVVNATHLPATNTTVPTVAHTPTPSHGVAPATIPKTQPAVFGTSSRGRPMVQAVVEQPKANCGCVTYHEELCPCAGRTTPKKVVIPQTDLDVTGESQTEVPDTSIKIVGRTEPSTAAAASESRVVASEGKVSIVGSVTNPSRTVLPKTTAA